MSLKIKSVLNFNNLSKFSGVSFISKRYQGGYTDDSYQKTTLIQLTKEEGYHLQITGVNQYGFIINNNIRTIGPIAIFPKTIYSWNVADINEINENSLLLFKLLEPKLDILIIGTGDKNSKINPAVPKWLIQNKINNFEILPTEKAVSAFNFLIAEDRFVGGAFLPSVIVREVDSSIKRVLDTSQFYIDKDSHKIDMTDKKVHERLENAKLDAENYDRKHNNKPNSNKN